MKIETTVLERHPVRLEPVSPAHAEGLKAACDADPLVFDTLYPAAFHGAHFEAAFARLLEARATGSAIPFAVVVDGVVSGMTSFLAPDAVNAAVEVGGTYYAPGVRGGLVNPAAKRLLLGHAFASGCRRASFRVDALNVRSRAAVVKLGAVFEGILRQDRVVWTGRIRDTAIYSVLASEWPVVQERLEARLAQG